MPYHVKFQILPHKDNYNNRITFYYRPLFSVI